MSYPEGSDVKHINWALGKHIRYKYYTPIKMWNNCLNLYVVKQASDVFETIQSV